MTERMSSCSCHDAVCITMPYNLGNAAANKKWRCKDGTAMTDDEPLQIATIFFPVGHLNLVELLCLHHWVGLGDGIPSYSPVVELAVMLVGIAVQ